VVGAHAPRDELIEAIERNLGAAAEVRPGVGVALEELLMVDPVATCPNGEPVAAAVLAGFTRLGPSSKDRAAGVRAAVDAVLSHRLQPALESPWLRPALDGRTLFELLAASGVAADMAQAVRLVPYTPATARMFERGVTMMDVAVVCLADSVVPAEARRLFDAAIEHEVALASTLPEREPLTGTGEGDERGSKSASNFDRAPYASVEGAVDALMGSQLPDAETLALRLWDAMPQRDARAVVAGEPLLFRALGLGRPRVAARLLDQGAAVDATLHGRTAAHRAVAGGCFTLFQRLHAAGVVLHDDNDALESAGGVPQPLACALNASSARTALTAMIKLVPALGVTWEALQTHQFSGDKVYTELLLTTANSEPVL
jgi:hypothetical protein